jgi:hypothetical protein
MRPEENHAERTTARKIPRELFLPPAVSRQTNSDIPMKKTLLFSTLAVGIALTGCGRDTRTSTAPTDTTTTTTDTTTGTTTTAGTTTTVDPYAARTDAAARDVASDVRTGTSNAAAATREAGRDVADATREVGRDMREAGREAGQEVREFGRDASNALARAGENIEAKFDEWKLNAQDIEADLTADRPIVRTRTDGSTPTGEIDRSTLKNAVEGRIKADSQLANLKLDVDAKRGGEIEIDGKAQNAQQVARAMALALGTDGVVKVTSKVKLDEDAVRNR